MITPEETEAGLLAYEQVQAFAALRRKKLALVYVAFPILLLVMGVVACLSAAPGLGGICLFSAIAFSIFARWNWQRLRRVDADNRTLLAQLEARYGEELPWLQVERQQAAIRKIQAEQR